MFKIGEFSTIARVSDVLLRHYDDLDLFKPAYVNPENGYRYYAIEQLPELNRILALRDLGFALEDIRQLIQDGIQLDDIQQLLQQKESQLVQSILEEQRRLRRVRARLKQIRQAGTLSEHDVVKKTIPEQGFLSLRQRLRSLSDAGQYYYSLSEAVLNQPIKGLSYCVGLFHQPVFQTEDVDWELGFLLTEYVDAEIPLPTEQSLKVGTLPAVAAMATVIHQGAWSEMHLAFGALGAWMQVNGYQMDGPSREVYLRLVPPENELDFVVEVQHPVKKLDEGDTLNEKLEKI